MCAFSGSLILFMSNVTSKVQSFLFHWMCGHCIHSLTFEIANQNLWKLGEISIASFFTTRLFIITHSLSTRTVLFRWMFTKSSLILSAAAVMYRFDNWSDLTEISHWLNSVFTVGWSAYHARRHFLHYCQ